MKKYFTLILLTISFSAYSQDQKHRISLITDMDAEYFVQNGEFGFFGAQYQYALTNSQNLSTHLAFKGSGVIIGADYIYDFPIVGEKLEFNLGGGIGHYRYKSTAYDNGNKYTVKYNTTFFAGTVGFTYNFSSKPISILAAYRPKIDIDFDPIAPADILLGVGYRF